MQVMEGNGLTMVCVCMPRTEAVGNTGEEMEARLREVMGSTKRTEWSGMKGKNGRLARRGGEEGSR
jgi:hypothetical protein